MPTQKGYSIMTTNSLINFYFFMLEKERQQNRELKSSERELDREFRNLTLQEQKLV